MSCDTSPIRRCPFCGEPPCHSGLDLSGKWFRYTCPKDHVWDMPAGEPIFAPTYQTREMRPLR